MRDVRHAAGLIAVLAPILAGITAADVHAQTAPSPALLTRGHPHGDDPRLDIAPSQLAIDPPEPAPDSALADAIAAAYRTNPTLEAARYDLRATDAGLGAALSELRPNSEFQVIGQYTKTVPGRVTQAGRLFAASPIITANTLTAQLVVNQPIYTGGKATADIASARAAIRAGRAGLEVTEGDLLLQTITAYMDVRLADRTLAILLADVAQFSATLTEVRARRAAGELTQTDISQTETQLQSAQLQLEQIRLQLEQARASYATLVGKAPGALAPEPPLPQLPPTIDAAMDLAETADPDLAQVRFNEVASRERIASARAAYHPTFMLQGSAQLTGQGTPFYLYNDDQNFTVQGVLTIPLTSGGQTGAAVAGAENTNSGDRLRIEATRRLVTQNVLGAWNQMTATRRNLAIADDQVRSAKVFYEGSLAEYRAGVRSTFDALYAQEILINARIQQLTSRHDLYLAEATLLRYTGLLETRALTIGIDQYDTTSDIRPTERRGAAPWDAPLRALDRAGAASTRTRVLEQPSTPTQAPRLAPVMGPAPADGYAGARDELAEPGTSGVPVNELTRP